jgi:DNA-directed RNA polymerase subunit L
LEKLLEEAEESKHHDIKGNFKNLNRDRHYRKNKYLEADLFKICIESECSIQSIDIYSIAIRHLKESFSNMMDKNYKIENNKSFMTIIIPVGSHTTGNMLQAICFNRLIRENIDNTFGLTYIGYNIPHPLEQTMLIKVKGDDLVTIDDTITLFRDMLKIVIEELEQFENQWIIFSSKYKKT